MLLPSNSVLVPGNQSRYISYVCKGISTSINNGRSRRGPARQRCFNPSQITLGSRPFRLEHPLIFKNESFFDTFENTFEPGAQIQPWTLGRENFAQVQGQVTTILLCSASGGLLPFMIYSQSHRQRGVLSIVIIPLPRICPIPRPVSPPSCCSLPLLLLFPRRHSELESVARSRPLLLPSLSLYYNLPHLVFPPPV
jgi:hypothetical protein